MFKHAAVVGAPLATVAALGLPRAAAAASPFGWLNAVSDFGAPNNNTGDAAVQINAAIAAAVNLAGGGTGTGGVVYLPAGIYRVATPIIVRRDVVLMGSGSATTLRLTNTHPGAAIEFEPGSFSAKVRDLNIDGSAQQTWNAMNAGIRISSTGDTKRTGRDAFNVVENVTILHMSGHGVHIAQGSRSNQLLNVVVSNNGRNKVPAGAAPIPVHGFFVEGSDAVLTNCVAASTGKITSPIAGSHGFMLSGGNTQTVGCKAFYCAGDGFRVNASRQSLTNCQSQDNLGDGFRVTDTTGAMLSGVVADTNAQCGIALERTGGAMISAAMVTWRPEARNPPARYGIWVGPGVNRTSIAAVVLDAAAPESKFVYDPGADQATIAATVTV